MKKITVFIFVLLVFFAVKAEDIYEIVFKNYNLIDFKEFYIVRSTCMTSIDENFYILDNKQRKIFMFNKNGLIKVFGGAGQGPGKLSNPLTIFAMDNQIYCLERITGKIVVYNKNGIFSKVIKLKDKGEHNFFIENAIGYNHKIIVSYTLGTEFLRIYDTKGNYIDSIFKDREENKHIEHTYALSVNDNILCVFSKFDGQYFLVDLTDNKIIKTCLPNIDEELNLYREDALKLFEYGNNKHGSYANFTEFFPLFKTKTGNFCALYKIPATRQKGKTLKYICINKHSYKIKKVILIKGENVHLQDILNCNGFVVLVNSEGKVFLNREEI